MTVLAALTAQWRLVLGATPHREMNSIIPWLIGGLLLTTLLSFTITSLEGRELLNCYWARSFFLITAM